jgi:DNA-binding NarL/FixJ family response regulator
MRAWYDASRADTLLAEAYDALGDAPRAKEHRDAAEAVTRSLGVVVPAHRSPGDGVLTPREVEVLGLVALGAGNREVAEALSISEATVRRHLANIYLRLGVTTRTAAAAWAHQNGLIPHASA